MPGTSRAQMLQHQLPGTHRRRTNRRACVARRILHSAPCGTGVVLEAYLNNLYTAIGKTIETFGMAERVRFQLGG